jgi:hypothetical protein
MQFEELLGRPAPTFAQAPPALTFIQQLTLVNAAQQYGWHPAELPKELDEIRAYAHVSKHEFDSGKRYMDGPNVLGYLEERAATEIGQLLLKNGFIRRHMAEGFNPNAQGYDFNGPQLQFTWVLDIVRRPPYYTYQAKPMGNSFYTAKGEPRRPYTRGMEGPADTLTQTTYRG